MSAADEIIGLFRHWGHDAYFGESVSVLAHSLQTAWQARQAQATDALIAAALLHDVGHLLHGLPEDIAGNNVDGRHEAIGGEWLRARFGPDVTEPVRMHVDAKRYLCFSRPEYLAELSPSSIESLTLQGGLFTASEAAEFERRPHSRDAVALRLWDDRAKVPELVVPELATYRDLLDRVSLQSTAR